MVTLLVISGKLSIPALGSLIVRGQVPQPRLAREGLKQKGFTLLHEPHTEPWGQTVARLQSSEGAIIGLSYVPSMHS